MSLKLGKKPYVEDPRDLKWSTIKAGITLPPVPKPSGGYGTIFPAGPWPGWGMLGNGPCDDGSITNSNSYIYEGAGNCVWAGADHETMESIHNAKGIVPKVTCLSSLTNYASYLGLKDAQAINANNDQGTDVRSAMQLRSKTGTKDAEGGVHKIGIYVSLALTQQELWEGLYFFEAVGIGFNFPDSAMDQFNNGQEWTVVQGAQIEGGHYVPLVGHPNTNTWTAVTWGRRQTMTPNFINTYVDEAWAYITPERYNAVTGETLQGYKDADLEKYITMLPTA